MLPLNSAVGDLVLKPHCMAFCSIRNASLGGNMKALSSLWHRGALTAGKAVMPLTHFSQPNMWVNGWVNGWMDDGGLDGWMHERMKGWNDGWDNGSNWLRDGWVNGWIGDLLARWIDGWWMDAEQMDEKIGWAGFVNRWMCTVINLSSIMCQK